MTVLVVGPGAREHALAWKFSRSPQVDLVLSAPGCAGSASVSQRLPEVDGLDAAQVVEVCRTNKVDLVWVGPEAPLAAGLVDALTAVGIPAIGPPRDAARLESSKQFSAAFVQRYGLPAPASYTFSDLPAFQRHLQIHPGAWAVKLDGLAEGKGVLDSEDAAKLLAFGRAGLEQGELVVQEYLTGYELSVFVMMHSPDDYTVLPVVADFKKARDGDTGPNTGGMGAICPVPGVSQELTEQIRDSFVEPAMLGLKREGLGYRGVLFIGLMVTSSGPRILEFNVRLGDPETQVLLPALEVDLWDLAWAMYAGGVAQVPLSLKQHAACVVVASPGYPGSYPRGLPVADLPEEALIFHAGTTRGQESLATGGGRCFSAVGTADNLNAAVQRAYAAARGVRFQGAWFRQDIGRRFLTSQPSRKLG